MMVAHTTKSSPHHTHNKSAKKLTTTKSYFPSETNQYYKQATMSEDAPVDAPASAPTETKPEGGAEPITVRVRDQVSLSKECV